MALLTFFLFLVLFIFAYERFSGRIGRIEKTLKALKIGPDGKLFYDASPEPLSYPFVPVEDPVAAPPDPQPGPVSGVDLNAYDPYPASRSWETIKAAAHERVTGDIPAPPPFPTESRASEPEKPPAAKSPVPPIRPSAYEAPKKSALPPREPPSFSTRPAPVNIDAKLEFDLGSRWAVWIGAAFLALGSIFLVKFSIDNGIFGPTFRVLAGLIFSSLLLAAGELLRRRQTGEDDGKHGPNIPALLTGIGSLGLFGAIYSAHAIYGFIGMPIAFVLLGAVGIGTMFLSLLHGPALAGLGLVGSLVVPLVLAGHRPDPWSIVAYVSIVSASAMSFGWSKGWRALATAASIGLVLWTFLLTGLYPHQLAPVVLGLIALAMSLYAFYIHPGAYNAGSFDQKINNLVTVFQGVVLVLVVSSVSRTVPTAVFMILASIGIVLPVAASRGRREISGLSVIGLLIAVGSLLVWPVVNIHFPYRGVTSIWPQTMAIPLFLVWSAVMTLALGFVGLLNLPRGGKASQNWVLSSVLHLAVFPIAMLVIILSRISVFESTIVGGALSFVLTALYVPVIILLNREVLRSKTDDYSMVLVSVMGAFCGSLTLGLSYLLDGPSLTLALSIMAAVLARMIVLYDVPSLRVIVLGLAFAVFSRTALDPLLLRYGVSTMPIFNGISLMYGVPALCFGYASLLLSRFPSDKSVSLAAVQIVSGIFGGAFALLQIRHLSHGGVLDASAVNVLEVGLVVSVHHVVSAAAWSFGGRVSTDLQGRISTASFQVAVLLSLTLLATFLNPVFTGIPVGGSFPFNEIFLSYGLPALTAFGLVLVLVRRTAPFSIWMVRANALVLTFLAVTLWVRSAFHSGSLFLFAPMSQEELYSYSLAWLALGAGFMSYGLKFSSPQARISGLVLLFVTAGKVFLLDTSGLSGLYRAGSFIGLGMVLMLVGFIYQRRSSLMNAVR